MVRICVGFFLQLSNKVSQLTATNEGAHFWADPSRELIFAIEIALRLKRGLKQSKYAIEIDEYYLELLEKCNSFLSNAGSPIPANMEKIVLYYTMPIFYPILTQKIARSDLDSRQKLQFLGGSYALGHESPLRYL